MFAKKNRLPIEEKNQLQKICSSSCFVVKATDNNLSRNRFGIIISNSAVKKSTRRHFWKRVISENLSKWPNLKKDFLFIVSSKIEGFKKEQLKKEINRILENIS